ncbi:hypothetical protein Acr_03g0000540 [Actinidia rufa]|uniref:Uncharacterized protein n=1 Tax=Actinidia rufa TaxID=165716 RepID=A0A7J0EA56_9ERIC|nr:hypothetical protein Acr_03g0000540 [Actinidia rufa]
MLSLPSDNLAGDPRAMHVEGQVLEWVIYEPLTRLASNPHISPWGGEELRRRKGSRRRAPSCGAQRSRRAYLSRAKYHFKAIDNGASWGAHFEEGITLLEGSPQMGLFHGGGSPCEGAHSCGGIATKDS